MSDDAELVDIYDDELRKVGVATRYEAHKKGLWHFNFHCWVVTRRGKGAVLFQVRSESKPSFPGLLDSTVGGHYRAGERSADVTREIEEELGVRAEMKDLVPLGRRVDVASYHGVSKREIAEVFLLECGRPLSEYRVDASEVVGLVEVPIDSGPKALLRPRKENPGQGSDVGLGLGRVEGRQVEPRRGALRPQDGLLLHEPVRRGEEVSFGREVPLHMIALASLAC